MLVGVCVGGGQKEIGEEIMRACTNDEMFVSGQDAKGVDTSRAFAIFFVDSP